MTEWISFIVVIIETCMGYLVECTLMGVPLIGILVAVALTCIILSAILY